MARLVKDLAVGISSFQIVVGLGVVVCALIAVVYGKLEVRARVGATIVGVLTGTAIGLLSGAVFGTAASHVNMPVLQKAGYALGIYLGGPLGAIVGGVVGAVWNGSR
jgi:hypothetical protein